jgi:hypothetical protein
VKTARPIVELRSKTCQCRRFSTLRYRDQAQTADEPGLPSGNECHSFLLPTAVFRDGHAGVARICVHAPGFDRIAYHKDFDTAVAVHKYLLAAEKP